MFHSLYLHNAIWENFEIFPLMTFEFKVFKVAVSSQEWDTNVEERPHPSTAAFLFVLVLMMSSALFRWTDLSLFTIAASSTISTEQEGERWVRFGYVSVHCLFFILNLICPMKKCSIKFNLVIYQDFVCSILTGLPMILLSTLTNINTVLTSEFEMGILYFIYIKLSFLLLLI